MPANAIRRAEEKIPGGGGALFIRSWRPEGEARAVIVIVPGFNSHSGYYQWAGPRLAENGFATYALDLRGRGQSDGPRYFVETVEEYTADVGALVQTAKRREPNCPVYLFGHSAGGVISCIYTLDHPSDLSGLICESFAFQVYAPDFVLAVVKGISRVVPRAPILKLPNGDFSRLRSVVSAMDSDPFVNAEVEPASTVAAMARANSRLKAEFPRITLPLLILHGTADKVTKPGGSQFFDDTAGAADKTLRLYEGHVHDLLSDTGQEKVLDEIVAWVGARVGKQGQTSSMAGRSEAE